jgi:flagellar motor switch protein FliN
MTETPASAARPDPGAYVQAWVETWVDGLAQVLTQIGGSPSPWTALAESPPDLAPFAANDYWILCASSGGLRGEMSLRIPAASALRLAQIFMSAPASSEAPPPAAEVTAETREAVMELLRQVAGGVASALKTAWGEVQLRLDPAPGAPSWPASAVFWLRAGTDSPPAMLLEMHLSAALVAGLRAEKAEAAGSAPASPNPDESRAQLGLLMDVELALTLRFGSRRLLLREVLDLNPGAVVELDRKVEDPVDLLLDGRLVARGEVVVLNGNYGVRVTEVAPASP